MDNLEPEPHGLAMPPTDASPLIETPDLAVVLTTAPSIDVARTIARTLVQEQLAACVNVLPGVQSFYVWNDAVCDEAEVLCLIKTRHAQLPRLSERLQALHPYELPELVVLAAPSASAAYHRWVLALTGGAPAA